MGRGTRTAATARTCSPCRAQPIKCQAGTVRPDWEGEACLSRLARLGPCLLGIGASACPAFVRSFTAPAAPSRAQPPRPLRATQASAIIVNDCHTAVFATRAAVLQGTGARGSRAVYIPLQRRPNHRGACECVCVCVCVCVRTRERGLACKRVSVVRTCAREPRHVKRSAEENVNTLRLTPVPLARAGSPSLYPQPHPLFEPFLPNRARRGLSRAAQSGAEREGVARK